jgi:hypothetical protein
LRQALAEAVERRRKDPEFRARELVERIEANRADSTRLVKRAPRGRRARG